MSFYFDMEGFGLLYNKQKKIEKDTISKLMSKSSVTSVTDEG